MPEGDDIPQFIIRTTIIPDSIVSCGEKEIEKCKISMIDGSMESTHKKKLRHSVLVNNDVNECGSTSGMKGIAVDKAISMCLHDSSEILSQ